MRLSHSRATETQRHRGKIFFFCLCVSVPLWLVTATHAQDKPAAKRNVWDGVYSVKQAERGETLIAEKCATCHGGDMTGGAGVPGVAGVEFMFNWNNNRVGGLYDLISKTMPLDAPSSLGAAQYLDILAALLKFNGFPFTEMTDLPSTRESLDDILITRAKP